MTEPGEYWCERALKAEAEVKRLMNLIDRDSIAPCACCGVKLSWQFLGDATNCLEVVSGKPHSCPVKDLKDALPGTYRNMEQRALAAEAELKKLRGET